MVIKCEECKRTFQGNKVSPEVKFVCNFCMGYGLDPNKYHGKSVKTLKILDDILSETWILKRIDLDRLLAKVKEARDSLK